MVLFLGLVGWWDVHGLVEVVLFGGDWDPVGLVAWLLAVFDDVEFVEQAGHAPVLGESGLVHVVFDVADEL